MPQSEEKKQKEHTKFANVHACKFNTQAPHKVLLQREVLQVLPVKLLAPSSITWSSVAMSSELCVLGQSV